jgi:hypothetical protein
MISVNLLNENRPAQGPGAGLISFHPIETETKVNVAAMLVGEAMIISDRGPAR